MMAPSVDVLLVAPPTSSHYAVAPLGLGYLATALRRRGIDRVAILDAGLEGWSVAELAARVLASSPRVLGIQAHSVEVPAVSELLSRVASATEMVTVLGGAHASAVGADVFDHLPALRYAFVGEGEPGFPPLVASLLAGEAVDTTLPGLVYRGAAGAVANPRARVDDLDDNGWPAWDLIEPERYRGSPQGATYRRLPIAPLSSSRGCPFDCRFCASPVTSGRKLRMRSTADVLDEIEHLRSHHGVREIHFVDDAFNTRKARVLELCDGLEARGIDITYTFPNGIRLDRLDEEVARRMAETGAFSVTVGIESGSQRVLDLMRKGTSLGLIREKVELLARVGLSPSAFFILGFPGERRDEMLETIRFALSLPLERAHFSLFQPLPGTDATRELLESGALRRIDYERLFYTRAHYVPPGMTASELKALQRLAFVTFYGRPSRLSALVRSVRSPAHLASIARRAVAYLGLER